MPLELIVAAGIGASEVAAGAEAVAGAAELATGMEAAVGFTEAAGAEAVAGAAELATGVEAAVGVTEVAAGVDAAELTKAMAEIVIPHHIELPALEALGDTALEARIEAAAHSACQFFELPDAPLLQGDSIGVLTNPENAIAGDKFVYKLGQFKEMYCTSFEDLTKVWSHECGHRIIQDLIPNSWAEELGADFFSGVRSEMLGLPESNFEEIISSFSGSETHPPGDLRLQAIDFGRDVVAEMKSNGILPTWQNCMEKFCDSPFSQISYEDGPHHISPSLIDNNIVQIDNTHLAKNSFDWCAERSTNATSRGDFCAAKEYNQMAENFSTKVDEAEKISKLVSNTDVTDTRKLGGSYGELKKEGYGWSDINPHEIHHMPSCESSPLERNDGPAIVMDANDHRMTASCGNSREAQTYRAIQKEKIVSGDFRGAFQMDVEDIHDKFGDKYDAGIEQAYKYVDNLEQNKLI